MNRAYSCGVSSTFFWKLLKVFFLLLGIYQFRNNSLKPSDISSNTNVILLIITRWTSFDLRGALRQMLKNDDRTKFEYKTIFLFNYDDSASKEEIKRIEDENTVYKGGLFSLHIFGVVICPKVNICPEEINCCT